MSRIEWCDVTWNPVWGCNNNCPYCYARKIARRFFKKIYDKEIDYYFKKGILYKILEKNAYYFSNILYKLSRFIPVFIENNYAKKIPKKPSIIFVNSMSDIIEYESLWMKRILYTIGKHPEHIFIFLSKNQHAYKIEFPENVLKGFTIDSNNNTWFPITVDFLNIEPLQEKIILDLNAKISKWIIVGAETGNRKEKIIPKKFWIDEIVNFAKKNNIPIFLKNNLKNVWKEDLIQEYPEIIKIHLDKNKKN